MRRIVGWASKILRVTDAFVRARPRRAVAIGVATALVISGLMWFSGGETPPSSLPLGWSGDGPRQFLEAHTGSIDDWRKAAERGEARETYLLALCYATGVGAPQETERAIQLLSAAAQKRLPEAQYTLARVLLGEVPDRKDVNRGLVLMREASLGGLPRAHFDMAKIYDKGLGVATDRAEALRYYRLGADAGDADATGVVLQAVAAGEIEYLDAAPVAEREAAAGRPLAQFLVAAEALASGNDQQRTEAVTKLREAAKAGVPEAAYVLAMHLLAEEQRKADAEGKGKSAIASDEVRSLLTQASDKGLGEATLSLATLEEPADPARAEELLEQAAKQGETEAILMVAMRSELRGDVERAKSLYRDAATAGSAEAAVELGRVLRASSDSAEKTEALRWYRRASLAGSPEADLALGLLALDGELSADGEGAEDGLRAIRRAADAGLARAAFHLGQCYADGRGGVTANMFEATRWWMQAAFDPDGGDADAQHRLANCYRSGEGVPRDDTVARELLTEAAAQNHEPSRRELDQLGTVSAAR